MSTLHRLGFWAAALLPPLAVASWTGATGRNPTFATIAAATAGLLAAGTLPLHRDTPA